MSSESVLIIGGGPAGLMAAQRLADDPPGDPETSVAASMAKSYYIVQLHTPSGMVNALTSTDRRRIQRVISAMSDAMTRCG